jgi:hypothetical protein
MPEGIFMLEFNTTELQTNTSSKYLFYKGEEAVFQVRKINPATDEVEIWECRWTNPAHGKPQKEFIRKVGVEQASGQSSAEDYSTAEAICWAPGRTIGNIAVNSKELLGHFEGKSGTNATLPCQIIPCGKFRNGANRWYCKTHQNHWGTIGDKKAARESESNEIECSNKNLPMSYVVDPFEIEFKDFEEIGIWCGLPKALSSRPIKKRAPKIHVHRRKTGQEHKDIDGDFEAIVLSYDTASGLFQTEEITKIQVTPPAALEFLLALEEGREVACVSCKKCGYPHLDLGDFAKKPHKKHYCGNCGNDSVISSVPIVSTPLHPLREQFHNANQYTEPERTLDLDEFLSRGKFDFDIWPSTPAIIWTASRPQERGIHVHVYKDSQKIIDDTFSKVIYQGAELSRAELWAAMLKNTES